MRILQSGYVWGRVPTALSLISRTPAQEECGGIVQLRPCRLLSPRVPRASFLDETFLTAHLSNKGERAREGEGNREMERGVGVERQKERERDGFWFCSNK